MAQGYQVVRMVTTMRGTGYRTDQRPTNGLNMTLVMNSRYAQPLFGTIMKTLIRVEASTMSMCITQAMDQALLYWVIILGQKHLEIIIMRDLVAHILLELVHDM